MPNLSTLPDPQDPLPEANWLWRRVFTFAVLLIAFLVAAGLCYAVNRIVGNVVSRIDSMDAVNVAQITVVALRVIADMFKLMCYLLALNMLLYVVAPSAEQITKMLQTARLLRAGVQITSSAKAETPMQREETRANIGIPAPQPHQGAPAPSTPPEAAEPPIDAPWAKKE